MKLDADKVCLLIILTHSLSTHALVPTDGFYRAHAAARRRTSSLLAEPIPVGTQPGASVYVRPVNDRSMNLYPSDRGPFSDGQPLARPGDLAALKSQSEGAVQAAGSFDLLPFGSLDLVASALFAVVLWFGVLNDLFFPRAARPSDIVLPALGRLLGMEGKWLDDFEKGSRGEFPATILAISVPIFLLGGAAVETLARFLYGSMSGDSSAFAFSIGVIGCIWAGVYEIGRVDTGDALRTREEDEERERVRQEFQDFAEKNIERCSETQSVNQVEIVRVFRRSYARHRRVDQEGSAPDELIIRALRLWYQSSYGTIDDGYGSRDSVLSKAPPPTASGFFKGLRLKSRALLEF